MLGPQQLNLRVTISRGPQLQTDCRRPSRAYVPTARHPPRTCASAFFLLVPGEPDKAWLADPSCGHPVPPAPAACASLAEVSPANAHAAPDVSSRLLLFLDTEGLDGTRPGSPPLCARGSEETKQK